MNIPIETVRDATLAAAARWLHEQRASRMTATGATPWWVALQTPTSATAAQLAALLRAAQQHLGGAAGADAADTLIAALDYLTAQGGAAAAAGDTAETRSFSQPWLKVIAADEREFSLGGRVAGFTNEFLRFNIGSYTVRLVPPDDHAPLMQVVDLRPPGALVVFRSTP